MYFKSINLKEGSTGPSDYTIKFLLDFSKSLKIIDLKTIKKIRINCN